MSDVTAPSLATSDAPGALLAVRDLRVHFRVRRGLGGSRVVRAVDGVTFDLAAGETLGIAGESGSGKSTVARTLVQIIRPTDGAVTLDGVNVVNLKGQRLKRYRRRMQMVYQDPYDSLDPRMSVLDAIGEALSVRGVAKSKHAREVEDLLGRVNLPATVASRYPGQLSGGQRQRVSIARALAVNPEIIICDEAVAALDVSIRAQVLNLLKDIQRDTGVGYVFISHDLSTLRFMADRVAIMYVGRVVEFGTSEQVFSHPQHPYTKALIAAVPSVNARGRERLRLSGEPPDPGNPPSGCPFHPRCPEAVARCAEVRPDLEADRRRLERRVPRRARRAGFVGERGGVVINLPESELAAGLGESEPTVLGQPNFWRRAGKSLLHDPVALCSMLFIALLGRGRGVRAVDRALQPAARVRQRPVRRRRAGGPERPLPARHRRGGPRRALAPDLRRAGVPAGGRRGDRAGLGDRRARRHRRRLRRAASPSRSSCD